MDSGASYPEDFRLENGRYCCSCCICGNTFIGYKRRVVCRNCANTTAKGVNMDTTKATPDKHPFEYQAPSPDEVQRITMIREDCKRLYENVMCLPNSRERSLAITKLEEVSMWANKAVVFHGAAMSQNGARTPDAP